MTEQVRGGDGISVSPRDDKVDILGDEGYETYVKEITSTGTVIIGCRQKWIKCNEQLPETIGNSRIRVLVFGSTCGCSCGINKMVVEANYRSDSQFEYGEFDCSINATHWMPLPKPPEIPND